MTSVLVIIVNSSVINEIKLFDPYVCLFVFDVFHVLTFIRFELYIAFWRIIRKLVRKRNQLNAKNTPGHQFMLNIP